MKYGYKELTGKCKNCLGCMRLEDPNFVGTNECEYADNPIQPIKEILGIQQKINFGGAINE